MHRQKGNITHNGTQSQYQVSCELLYWVPIMHIANSVVSIKLINNIVRVDYCMLVNAHKSPTLQALSYHAVKHYTVVVMYLSKLSTINLNHNAMLTLARSSDN